jgi:hypothetical protein
MTKEDENLMHERVRWGHEAMKHARGYPYAPADPAAEAGEKPISVRLF